MQRDFFDNTNIWYERRRGEFRVNFASVEKVSNEDFASAFLAFNLQRPVDSKQKKASFFKAKKEEGFYEDIFNDGTKYEDMLTAHCLDWYIDNERRAFKKKFDSITPGVRGNYLKKDMPVIEHEFILHASAHILALFKKQLSKYYKPQELNGKIYWEYENGAFSKWDKCYDAIIKKLWKHVKLLKSDPTFSLTKYFKSTDHENEVLSLI